LWPNSSLYLSSFPSLLHAVPTQTFTAIPKPHLLHHTITVYGQITILNYYPFSKTLSLYSALKLKTQHKFYMKNYYCVYFIVYILHRRRDYKLYWIKSQLAFSELILLVILPWLYLVWAMYFPYKRISVVHIF
jgi:hypothetical protein